MAEGTSSLGYHEACSLNTKCEEEKKGAPFVFRGPALVLNKRTTTYCRHLWHGSLEPDVFSAVLYNLSNRFHKDAGSFY